MKIIISNPKVYKFEIIERYQAGIQLKGAEVKSLRESRGSLKESFGISKNGEIYLYGFHIPLYQNTPFKHNPYRPKKLLLHKSEIKRISGRVSRKGLTIIPVKAYFNDRGFAKVEIALVKPKKKKDIRDSLRKKEIEKEIRREVKRYSW